MHEFAFLFRSTRPLGPDETARRNAAARQWALARLDEGLITTATPLEPNGFTVSELGVGPEKHEQPIGAVLVVRVKDIDAAVALAKGHPGIGFGTEIEVRPVKPVVVPAR